MSVAKELRAAPKERAARPVPLVSAADLEFDDVGKGAWASRVLARWQELVDSGFLIGGRGDTFARSQPLGGGSQLSLLIGEDRISFGQLAFQTVDKSSSCLERINIDFGLHCRIGGA